MKQELKNEMFEAMLRSAFQDHAKTAEPELETREELQAQGVELHSFSPEFEGKMKKLIKKTKRKAWWSDHRKRVQRTAAMFAVLIAAGGVLVTQVDAVRIPVMSFIISVNEKFSEIQIGSSGENSVLSEKFQDYLPTYLPEGFVVENVNEERNSVEVQYVKEDGSGYFFVLTISPASKGGAYDTENATIREISIQGYPAVLIEKVKDGTEYTQLIWVPKNGEYHIAGYLPAEEAVQMLESVQNFF